MPGALEGPSKRQRGLCPLGKPDGKLERSRAQEERVARHIGGRRQPASGAFLGFKGDVKSREYLVECKRTDKGSITIHGEWLEKVYKEALEAGKEPAVEIEIGGIAEHAQRWVMIPTRLWSGRLEE